MPRISVIMNALNAERFMREAIESIYAQTYSDWEIIFWDNCSTDATAVIAHAFDERLRYFRGEQTVPLGTARNLALRQATGDFIAFLDADDIWEKIKLERQVALMNRDQSLGLVAGNAIIFYEDNRRPSRIFCSNPRKLQVPNVFRHALLHYGQTVCMPTVMVRKTALHSQPEWFDERFQIATDFDLFLRILYTWQFAFIPEPIARYRVHPSATSKKYVEKSVQELHDSLEKFTRLLPGFAGSYKKELEIMRKSMIKSKSIQLWKAGDGCRARIELMKIIFLPTSWFYFACTFYPFRYLEKIRNSLEHVFRPNIKT